MADNAEAAATQDEAAQAYEKLYRKVAAHEFLARLAEHGHHANTDADAARLLYLGEQLGVAAAAQRTKQAAAAGDFYQAAVDRLDQVLYQGTPYSNSAEEASVKRAAAKYANDPELVKAANVLQRAALAARS